MLKGIILPSVSDTLILGIIAKILQKWFTILNFFFKRSFTHWVDLFFLMLWGMGKHGACLSSESWPYPQLCRVNMTIFSIELRGWKASLCFLSSQHCKVRIPSEIIFICSIEIGQLENLSIRTDIRDDKHLGEMKYLIHLLEMYLRKGLPLGQLWKATAGCQIIGKG